MKVFGTTKMEITLVFGVTVRKKISLMASGNPGMALSEEFGTILKILKLLVHGVMKMAQNKELGLRILMNHQSSMIPHLKKKIQMSQPVVNLRVNLVTPLNTNVLKALFALM